MKRDGALLCLAGSNVEENVIGALVSNIWESYDKLEAIGHRSNLRFMMFENQSGKVAITRISNFLLCLCGNETVEFGLLKKKVGILLCLFCMQLLILEQHLSGPLKQVYP